VSLIADWKMFEFVLFNVIQNAVKYNIFKGKIVICIALEKLLNDQQDQTENFKIEVIDTGIGIDEDRQQLLFKPFLELQQKQDLNLVKDRSIGLGLACSYEIITRLKGTISLTKSKNNLTVFTFKMPVEV
jgi:K+-sensing histidine kinase KdpD